MDAKRSKKGQGGRWSGGEGRDGAGEKGPGEAGGGAGWPGGSVGGEKRVEFRKVFCHDISFLLLLSLMTINMLVAQLCPSLCGPIDCSPSGSSVHGILQARILEWVAIPFSRGSSPQKMQIKKIASLSKSQVICGNRATEPLPP